MRTVFEELSGLPNLEENTAAALAEAKRIRVDNVFEFMNTDKLGFTSIINDLPIVISPFPVTWFEFDIHYGQTKQEYASLGYLLIRENIEECQSLQLPQRVMDIGAGWVMYAMAFSRAGKVAATYADGSSTLIHLEEGKAPVSFLVSLSEEGRILGNQDNTMVSFSRNYSELLNSGGNLQAAIALERELFGVVLFSLILLNCKNVSLDVVQPSVARKHRNRHAQPAVSYHVLKIKPMAVRRRGIGEWVGGSSPSLHIRRGHFKDYREGAG